MKSPPLISRCPDLPLTGVGDALLPAPAWFTPAVAGGPVGKLNYKATTECSLV